MHKYLRAIGFSKIRHNHEQNKLISLALENATERKEIQIASNHNLLQVNHLFAKNIGLSIIAEYNHDDILDVDHIFPYCIGEYKTEQLDIQIECHSDKQAYSAVSDDCNLEITLIYAVQNIVDYVKSNWSNTYYQNPTQVIFGALSITGRIIYGVQLEYNAYPYEKQPISDKDRSKLIAKAKMGDMDALESLTLDDMDTYSLVSKRIQEEDLLTIVDTYFMPYGIDNEQYSILGKIINFFKITNEISGEMVYNLTVESNHVLMNIVINSIDLEGEPAIGRRFKGIIWLQGHVLF